MKIGGAIVNGLALTLFLVPARAEEISVKVLQSLSTPAEVKTRIGNLTFKDGAPSDATLDVVYDNLTFTHALNTFLNSMEGVSIEAARKGFESIGVEDNEVLVFSKLMDAKSLFLTANADTVYALGVLDLTKGPMVLEVPPRLLGTIDDHWFRWVIDIGLPGPDRGEGGKYLIVPPGYDRQLPEGGYFIAYAKILSEAAEVGNATSRSLFMHPRDPSWFYYPDSAWNNYLFETGYQFETPIPEITPAGVKPFPPTGYRTLDARTNFFYGITGISPAMAMRLPSIGSQYLFATLDATKHYLDGAKTYKVILPKGIPAVNFWSLTLYDNQTRSMLDTPQRFSRAGSQSYPSPSADAAEDGSTTVWFAPEQPHGVARGNWIQTDPQKGFFVILRLYGPGEPFFDKSWRISEIESVK